MCQCPRPSQPWSSMAQIERYLETAPPSLLHKCPGSSNERVVRCVGINRSESVDVYVSATKPRRGSHSTTNLSTRASECRTHVESESSSYVGRSSKSSREKRGRRERVKRMTKNDAPLAKRCNEERGSSAMRPMCVAAWQRGSGGSVTARAARAAARGKRERLGFCPSSGQFCDSRCRCKQQQTMTNCTTTLVGPSLPVPTRISWVCLGFGIGRMIPACMA